MRPGRRWSPAFLGSVAAGLRGAMMTPAGVRRSTGRASSSSSPRVGRRRSVSVGAAGVAGVAAGGAVRRRGASAPRDAGSAAWAVTVASTDWRASSAAFAWAASSAARRVSSSAALRASSSRRRASSAADRMEMVSCSRRSASRRALSRCCSTKARWRAASSVAVRARPAPAGGRPGADGPRAVTGAVVWAPGTGVTGPPGAPGVGARFLRTSTCTTLDRPWLKLCRTEPASTVRPSSSRPAGRSDSLALPAS
jgi:hypothetical protein